MINQTIKGEVQGVQTVSKKVKDKDDNKTTIIYQQIKLASADIDYEEMNDFNPNIAQTLLNIQPMPFDSIVFGEQNDKNLAINIKLIVEENPDPHYQGVDMVGIQIKKIIVTVRENIPIYNFLIWIPIDRNPDYKYLSEFHKRHVEFSLYNMK